MATHLLAARHAYREGDKQACGVKGTRQVSTEIEDVTCRTCKHWYWHVEGLELSPQGLAHLQSLTNAG